MLDIGLVNNMPDGALRATERQFHSLLHAAAQGSVVRLRLYTLPGVRRSDWAQAHVSATYASIDDLWDHAHDGLIVTGMEPRAANLVDEPYWEHLCRVVEWAERNTHSTVWSCLAAHAAVLHLDDIARRPLADKRFGVFDCVRVADHPIVASAPSRFQMPHSRCNGLSENDLVSRGYSVLTRSKEAGVDTFVKQRKSLFVFLQGHPEYDTDSLLLEYRRDAGRFLRGERETYPAMPKGYFDRCTADALFALQERAVSDRREERLADFNVDRIRERLTNTWRSGAECLYRNWLMHVRAQKARSLERQPIGCATSSTFRIN